MLEAAVIGGTIVVFMLLWARRDPVWGQRSRIQRALRKASRTTLADFPERTPAKVVGTVAYEAGQALTAPITGRRCAAYALVVYVNFGDGPERVQYSTEAVPFRIVDDTGYAVVDPSGGQVSPHIDDYSKTATASVETRLRQTAFLERFGLPTDRDCEFSEGVIEEGEPVAVLGYGARELDPNPTAHHGLYRSAPATRLRIRGGPKLPILISDSEDTLGA